MNLLDTGFYQCVNESVVHYTTTAIDVMLAGGDEKFRENVKEAMTASTRGNMRPNGRSPPFLAIGLFIALCVMGFNYWSLSAKNAEQANEISILNSEKLTARATSEKRIDSLSTQITSMQRDLNTAKEQKESEALKFKDERQALEVSSTLFCFW